jgi:hypothetical protein
MPTDPAHRRPAGLDDTTISRQLIGRNVVEGRWTYQLVEEYDDGYYALFKELDRVARAELAGGRRQPHEAEMKDRRRTEGQPGHEAGPCEPS